MRRKTIIREKTKSEEKVELSRVMDSINAAKTELERVKSETKTATEVCGQSTVVVEKLLRETKELKDEVIDRRVAVTRLREEQGEEESLKSRLIAGNKLLSKENASLKLSNDELIKESNKVVLDRGTALKGLEAKTEKKILLKSRDLKDLTSEVKVGLSKKELLEEQSGGLIKLIKDQEKSIASGKLILSLQNEKISMRRSEIEDLDSTFDKKQSNLDVLAGKISVLATDLVELEKAKLEIDDKTEKGKLAMVALITREKQIRNAKNEIEGLYKAAGLEVKI